MNTPERRNLAISQFLSVSMFVGNARGRLLKPFHVNKGSAISIRPCFFVLYMHERVIGCFDMSYVFLHALDVLTHLYAACARMNNLTVGGRSRFAFMN